MKPILPFLLLSALAFPVDPHPTRELKMALIFSRHGARYPEAPSVDPSLKGQLTGIGQKMGRQLGKYFRDKYNSILPRSFDRKRDFVIASGLERNIEFAKIVMEETFKNELLFELNPRFPSFEAQNYQKSELPRANLTAFALKIPVHTQLKDKNYIFAAYDPKVCPLAPNLYRTGGMREKLLMVEVEKFLLELEKEFDYRKIIPKLKSPGDIYPIYDYLYSYKYMGNNLVSENLMKRVNYLNSAAFVLKFGKETYTTFSLNGILRRMINYLKKAKIAIKNGREDYKNFVFMVGHDFNINQILMELGYSTFACLFKKVKGEPSRRDCYDSVGFSTTISFEVYSENRELFVDFLIDGEKKGFCSKNDGEKCSISETIGVLESFSSDESPKNLMQSYCKANFTTPAEGIYKTQIIETKNEKQG